MYNINSPNLFIPGAAKSGSSSLHEYLKRHPDIFMSETKEPHFFSDDYKFLNEKEEYFKLFENSNAFKYRGESSTGYMVFEKSIERIKHDCKDPKFIFILRNPIDRIFSHYNWVKSLNSEVNDFKSAIMDDFDELPDSENGFGGGYKYYYQFGLYAKWIEKYIIAFGKENIFITSTESLRDDHNKVLNEIFKFLSIDAIDNIEEIKINTTKYYNNGIRIYHKLKNLKSKINHLGIIQKINLHSGIKEKLKSGFETNKKPKLSKNERLWLKELYADDVEKLKKHTGLNFDEWLDFQN